MKTRIVTTFNPDHWDTYVQNNLASMVKHIPAEMVVYRETEAQFHHARIVWRDLFKVPGFVRFMGQIEGLPAARGMFGGRYSYNHDIWKFCRKVFAQCDAAGEDADLLIWLDADVEVLQDVNPDTLREMLGDNAMGVYQRPEYHSECGIVLWNLKHPALKNFWPAYLGLYTQHQIFRCPMGWHDCWALDATVASMGVPVANLSPAIRTGGNDALDVIPKSALAPYFRHDKGAKKHAA